MKHCDRRMLKYIADVSWKDKVNSEEVAKRCGLKEIQEKMRQRRLQWFGHVRREEECRGNEELDRWEGQKELGIRQCRWLWTC